MANFDDLQELWQQQVTPEPVSTRDAASLAKDLRKFGRRQDLINGAKLALMVWQVVVLVMRYRHDPVRMFGMMVLDCCVLYFLLNEWRNQRAVARLNFAASSVEFVRDAIARMEALKNPFRGREFYILMGGIWVGMNLIMPQSGWIWRLVWAVFPFAIYKPSVYLREKRWNHEAGPIVQRLRELLDAAEGKAI